MLVYDKADKITARAALEVVSDADGLTDSLAFSEERTLTLRVRVPRVFCAERVTMRIWHDSTQTRSEHPCELVEFADATDDFAVTLELSRLGVGLYYLDFRVDGTVHGYIGRDGGFVCEAHEVKSTQLTVYSRDFKTPERFRGGMIYQIFPDRFARSGRVEKIPEGRVFNPDWEHGVPQFAEKPGGEVANNEFFGGDLWGIADRLDYIKSLGVDTLYLCPIFRAASNHRYDTGDYAEIDPLLGGEAAFEHLLAELKKRGMKLILDGVFNHTGADSRYFNKFSTYPGVGACHSKRSKFHKWYCFEDFPGKYRCWWGVKILPAVNSEEPSWREFICGEKGIVRHYLRKGIDGWRLDVADELSDVFLEELRAAAKAEDSEAIVLGEVWEDASNKVAYDKRRRYFQGGQLDSVMNYPLKEGVIDFILSGDSTRLREVSQTLWRHYPRGVSHVLMNFLGTHDTERILTVLADEGTRWMTNAELSTFRLSPLKHSLATDRLRLAWALLCAFPGVPCLYYGDEVGMEGGRDPFNRLPFVPNHGDSELTHFFRRIGTIRRSEPVFASGGFELVETGDSGQLVFIREDERTRLVVAANLTMREHIIEFERAPERLISLGDCTRFARVAPMSVEYFRLEGRR